RAPDAALRLSGVDASVPREARRDHRMDLALAAGGRRRLSRGRDGVPPRHVRPRPLWQALSRVRRSRAADRLCGERDELLSALPDGRQAAGGSFALPPPPRRLAADAGGAGGAAALVSVEMLACDHLARRIEPHHLTEARPGSAEMWQGHSAPLLLGRPKPEPATRP